MRNYQYQNQQQPLGVVDDEIVLKAQTLAASTASLDYSAPKKTPMYVGDEMKAMLGASLGSLDYSPAGAKSMATIAPTPNFKAIPVQVVPFGNAQTG